MYRNVSHLISSYSLNKTTEKGVRTLIQLFSETFKINVYTDKTTFPEKMYFLTKMSEKLQQTGTISNSFPFIQYMYDVPYFTAWTTKHSNGMSAGGITIRDPYYAAVASLAEGVERSLWHNEIDYFLNPVVSSFSELSQTAVALNPHVCVGLSSDARRSSTRIAFNEQTRAMWIQAYSHSLKNAVYVPAQLVSKKYFLDVRDASTEPTLFVPITTGLATGENEVDALLGGALEIIERDAYMILWLNQLSLPRIPESYILEYADPLLQNLFTLCSQNQLSVHCMRMITDAPTHAILTIVTDSKRGMSYTTLGMCAHRSLLHAIEKSLLEALRGRQNLIIKRFNSDLGEEKKFDEITLNDRDVYWTQNNRGQLLSFLYAGEYERVPVVAPWENDTPQEHLARITAWCRDKKYDLLSVNLGTSKKNITPWHIHMMLIPQLQPMNGSEKYPYTDGIRLSEIPKQFGYTPRTPYIEHPHPFV
jgi:thiazole/oxazole-forming peptide maturase SagD family component